jgi:hypothetical protein
MKLKFILFVLALGLFFFFLPSRQEVMADSNPVIVLPDGGDQSLEFGLNYSYQVIVSNFEGNVQFNLENSPSGASINNIGLINWIPSQEAYLSNPHEFKVKVSDQNQNEKTITWEVFIKAPLEITTQPKNESWVINFSYTSYRIYYQKAADISLLSRKIEAFDSNGHPLSLEDLKTTKGENYYEINFTPKEEKIYHLVLTVRGKSSRYQAEILPQTFSFQVNTILNQAPVFFNFNPSLETQVNALYQFQPEVFDPNNHSLEYSLSKAPEGATINPETGLINWTPSLRNLLNKDNFFTLFVKDNFEGSTQVTWEVSVFDEYEKDNSFESSSTDFCSLIFKNNISLLEQIAEIEKNNLHPCQFRNLHNNLDEDFIKFEILKENDSPYSFWIALFDLENNLSENNDLVLFNENQNPVTADLEYRKEGVFAVLPPGIYFLKISGSPKVYRPVLLQNLRPSLASTLPQNLEIEENQELLLDFHCEDTNFDELEYSIDTESQNKKMTVDSLNGQFKWQTDFQSAGNHSLSVEVVEKNTPFLSHLPTTLFHYSFKVINLNRFPSFSSILNQEIFENNLFEYPVKALDADNENLTYFLTSSPEGASIDSQSGIISWTKPFLGKHVFTVNVKDVYDAVTSSSFTLNVKKFLDKINPNLLTENPSSQNLQEENSKNNGSDIPLVEEIENSLLESAQVAGISDNRLLEKDPEENASHEENNSTQSEENNIENPSLSALSADQSSSKNTWIIVSIVAVVGAAGYLAFYFTKPI